MKNSLLVSNLPPEKDRVDLLDYIRSTFRDAFVRIVYQTEGRNYLIFKTEELASNALKEILNTTALSVEAAPEDYHYQPKSRPKMQPTPNLKISSEDTLLTKNELQKLLNCYRGCNDVEFIEDTDSKLDKAPGRQRGGGYVANITFRDKYFAEQAFTDITTATNISATYMDRPKRGMRWEKKNHRIDADKVSWIVIKQIPENINFDTLKKDLVSLEGFKLISFQADSLLVAFVNEHSADRAFNIQNFYKVQIHRASEEDVSAFRYPSFRNVETPPTTTLAIRVPRWVSTAKIVEIVGGYEGFEDSKTFKEQVVARFSSEHDCQKALEDLESTTDLYIEYSNPLPNNNRLSKSANAGKFQKPAESFRGDKRNSTPGPVNGGPWALFIAEMDQKFNIRNYFGSIAGFEKLAVFDEGCYVWFFSQEHAAAASVYIAADKNLSSTIIEKHKPRDRYMQANQNEHQTSSLFIRNVPGLPRETLLMILEDYPGYVTYRGLADYIIVDFADVNSSRAVLNDLRASTNIRVDFSNKNARSLDSQMSKAVDEEEVKSVQSEEDKMSKNSGPRTIYVTNLGNKDKADILQSVIHLNGFERCQFGQANFRLVMKDADYAQEAMGKIKFLGKNMKASFARKEPESKKIAELGEPSKVLWTSTLYWNETEFIKMIRTFDGFEKLNFEAAHSWVHFREIEQARQALTFFNAHTNLFSVFSSKKFGNDTPRAAAQSQVRNIDPRQAWESTDSNISPPRYDNSHVNSNYGGLVGTYTSPARDSAQTAAGNQMLSNDNRAHQRTVSGPSRAIPIIHPNTKQYVIPNQQQLQAGSNLVPPAPSSTQSSASSLQSNSDKKSLKDFVAPVIASKTLDLQNNVSTKNAIESTAAKALENSKDHEIIEESNLSSVDPWSLPPSKTPAVEAKVTPVLQAIRPTVITRIHSDDAIWGKVEGVASTPQEMVFSPVQRFQQSLRGNSGGASIDTRISSRGSVESFDSNIPTPVTPGVFRDWEPPEFDGAWGEMGDEDDLIPLPKTIPSKRTKAQKIQMMRQQGLHSPKWNSPYSAASSANSDPSTKVPRALPNPVPPTFEGSVPKSAHPLSAGVIYHDLPPPTEETAQQANITNAQNSSDTLSSDGVTFSVAHSDYVPNSENLTNPPENTQNGSFMELKLSRAIQESSNLRSQLANTTMKLDRVQSVIDLTYEKLNEILGESHVNKYRNNIWQSAAGDMGVEEKAALLSSIVLGIAKELSETTRRTDPPKTNGYPSESTRLETVVEEDASGFVIPHSQLQDEILTKQQESTETTTKSDANTPQPYLLRTVNLSSGEVVASPIPHEDFKVFSNPKDTILVENNDGEVAGYRKRRRRQPPQRAQTSYSTAGTITMAAAAFLGIAYVARRWSFSS